MTSVNREIAPAAAVSANRTADARPSSDWGVLRRFLPYLWRYRWRVVLALMFVIAGKLANMGVPIMLKRLVDAMTLPPGGGALLVVPVALLIGYGALRLATSVFTELRELVFAQATEGASRSLALEVFRHLNALSMRFHMDRQTGGMTRDIERGVRGIHTLISYSLYSIVPTIVEFALVLGYLGVTFGGSYALVAAVALAIYILFTVKVTQWRTHFRREQNQLDSRANSRAIDALLNYETVKYFGNEEFEARRYDRDLNELRRVAVKAQRSLSALNMGQQCIIAVALVVMLWLATRGVAAGRMTLGDLVMVNAFMIQLYIPLNFLGVIYREIKQAVTDLERMMLLLEQQREVADAPHAQPMAVTAGTVEFDDVRFGYEPNREILHGVSFTVPGGRMVAVVGASGAGKSTLSRLLFRFYDVTGGAIRIDGQDIREVTQATLRRAIGIVPQDTVLFNDTIGYNIAYGHPGATQAEVEAAARAARIDEFIASLPNGYGTMVGERGLKLSGGEKQRVAIARTLLKDPPILVFDEATSALDSANERAIQRELARAAHGKTALVIAHRLSTVVGAHLILVMDAGRIVERGTHDELLAADGRYANMWRLQEGMERNVLA